MSKLIWFGAWTCIVIWSLLCWAAFGLIDVASGLATGSSNIFTSLVPGSETLVRGLIDIADDVGELLLFLMWGGVSGLIFASAWFTERVLAPGAKHLLSDMPPSYAPMGAGPQPTARDMHAHRAAAQAFDRLGDRGVKKLRRTPGKDEWRAS